MSFVGILTEHKNEVYLKKKLEKEQFKEVFFLNEKTIDNMKNIKFETLLIGKQIIEKYDTIRTMAQKANYVIMNSDVKENMSVVENLDLTIITYGYNQKATITTSSVEQNKLIICLQRNIKNVHKEEIEAQEIEMDSSKDANDYAIMELVGLNLLYTPVN